MAQFLYTPPNTKPTYKAAIVLASLLLLYFIIYLVRVYVYWEDNAVKCDTDNILYAWITGKMPEWARVCMNYRPSKLKK